MGVVYKAEDTKLDGTVALKSLAPHPLKDEEANKRFHREAKAAASLHHPNVRPVYEIAEAEGRTFISISPAVDLYDTPCAGEPLDRAGARRR